MKTIVDTNFLFVCTLTHLIQFFTDIWQRLHKIITKLVTQEHITEQG